MANSGYFVSSCLSVSSHGATELTMNGFFFFGNLIQSIFENSVENIHVSLKSDKNIGYFA